MSRVIAAAAVRFRFYISEVQCMADPVVRVLDFEGPLDLLIHLIEKNKMDIYDIPIVSITDQYIEYLHSLTEMDLEAASQFLVMASLLLQIKSRMLLPKTELDEEDEASWVEICSELSSYTDVLFSIKDGETAESVKVEGASDALLIRSSGQNAYNKLSIRRELAEKIRLRDPDCVLKDIWELKNRTSIYFVDCTAESNEVRSRRDADILLKIYNGE